MHIEHFSQPDDFLAVAEDYLLAAEARHNMFFGVCDSIRRFPERYPDIYMAAVRKDDVVMGIGLLTLPFNLLLSDLRDRQAIDLFAADIANNRKLKLPGVVATAADSLAFAQRYSSLTDGSFQPSLKMRIYKLETVRPVTGIPGSMQPATSGDRSVLVDWFIEFEREALHEEPDRARFEQLVDNYLSLDWPRLFVWVDHGVPVSMTARTGPTPNGMRINAVYTPPQLRKRGYASALVAGVSQSILDSGKTFCFLFTDRANPTSNHIYQEIGYEPVCDVDEYKFD